MTKHPRIRVAFLPVFTIAAVLSGASAQAYFAGGGKDAAKGNDCLIGYNGIDQSQVTLDGKKQIVTCTDCDPSCDHDGVNSANGTCTLAVGVCINQSGVEACTPPSGLDKASAKGKVKGVKGASGKIDIDVSQLLQGSECGAFLDVDVPTKETKKAVKDGKFTLTLKGSVKPDSGKKRKDTDKLTYVCAPRPAGEDCPAVTTTTTSTSTTTSTIKPCGNGVVDAAEECDPNANPTGCTGGDTCIPDCTCASNCAAPGAGEPTGLTFRTSVGTTQCGSPGFTPTVSSPPFGGFLDATSCTCATAADCVLPATCVQGHCTSGAPERVACSDNGDCATGHTCEPYTIDLGLGCLYIGGGVSTVPGGATPNDAPNTFGVDLVCDGGDTLALGGGDTGSPKTCTLQDGPSKYCANGNPGNGPNNACDSDGDCRPNCVDIVCHDGGANDGQPCDPTDTAFCASGQCFGSCVNGAPGRDGLGTCATGNQCGTGSEGTPGIDGLICVPRPNCFFGPPLPVRNDALSTCVLNVFDTDAFGVAHRTAGEVTVGYTLSSRVFFTSLSYTPDGSPRAEPCPMCVDGTCNAGPNEGLACTGVGNDRTTQDCPPDGFFFLAPLSVTLDPLTTGTSTRPLDGTASADGLFCPFQGNGGAFKVPSARLVTMQGSPAAGGLDASERPATLASAFCIPKTGSVVIDGAANLPGPGATTLGGTLKLEIP